MIDTTSAIIAATGILSFGASLLHYRLAKNKRHNNPSN
jgi:hypothetical protein